MTDQTPMLYGDGAHDDAPAIQALLDSGVACVYLPAPKAYYAIGSTLKIYSHQTIKLDATTEIRLMPMRNMCMLTNADPAAGDEHITVEGGIWNMDNERQEPRDAGLKVAPGDQYPRGYAPSFKPLGKEWDEARNLGGRPAMPRERTIFDGTKSIHTLIFTHVKYLTLRDLTIKNPRCFATYLSFLTYFTIENIRFDFNYGNPYAINMDGIHLDGGCRFGHIRNLQGRCFDDLLALNADDTLCGPIEDIEVDGLYADNCHSAVRMLSTGSWIRRVSISNVFGTYWQYGVGITRFHYRKNERDSLGLYEDIVLKNLFISKAPRLSLYCKDGTYEYPLIFIERLLHIGCLHIGHLRRQEEHSPTDTIYIGERTDMDELSVEHVRQENATGKPITLLRNEGRIGCLRLIDVRLPAEGILAGEGSVGTLIRAD